MPATKPVYVELVQELVDSVPDLQGVFRFGSTGTSTERSSSDVDLAILAARPLNGRDRWRLESRLAQIVRRDVDLVDLRTASTVLRAQVASTGERLAVIDEAACDEFEMISLSAYALLNEERREILRDIEQRGMVYGDDVYG